MGGAVLQTGWSGEAKEEEAAEAEEEADEEREWR